MRSIGFLVVCRFEMPFNIWCGTCGAHIGKGVRYNAQKKQVGMYFTTKIWEFGMKCHLCDGLIVIRTDPKVRARAIASVCMSGAMLCARCVDVKRRLLIQCEQR